VEQPQPAQHRFLKAVSRQPVDRTPIWIMRQAGRYLPEYREMRRSHSMLTMCRTPELACEVTLQPLRRFDLDAAILFSDLLIPLFALGVDFDIVEKRGPVLARAVRDADAIRALPAAADLRRVDYVFEAVRQIRAALPSTGRDVPLLGFAGAPFTIASYMIEGGPSRDFRETKLLMYRDPAAFELLMQRLADLVIGYLGAQARAGVAAVQLFDSWVGCLGPEDYRRHVFGPTRRVFEETRALGIPTIHFGTMNGTLIDLMAEAGGDVLGADWRLPLDQVRSRFPDRAVQGNLDPAALYAPQEVLARKIDAVLEAAGPEPGHIFNLGHGITPDVPVENVAFLVDTVHARTRRP